MAAGGGAWPEPRLDGRPGNRLPVPRPSRGHSGLAHRDSLVPQGRLAMNELTFDDPCLLFALHQEAREFLREFHPQQRFPGAPCPARFCGPSWLPVLVLETGTTSDGVEAA